MRWLSGIGAAGRWRHLRAPALARGRPLQCATDVGINTIEPLHHRSDREWGLGPQAPPPPCCRSGGPRSVGTVVPGRWSGRVGAGPIRGRSDGGVLRWCWWG